MNPIRPAGAPPSVAAPQAAVPMPSRHESTATQSAPRADSVEPGRLLQLNGRSVRLGSFKPLKSEQGRRLFTLALKPLGEVQEADARISNAPELALATGDRDYCYQTLASTPDHSCAHERPERLEVLARVDRAGNLKHLRAKSLSSPGLDSDEGYCLNMEFQPEQSRLERLPDELKLAINGHLTDNDSLALRASSVRLHGAANDTLSDATRFVIKHGHHLTQVGYGPDDMQGLAHRPDEERRFVTQQHRTLHALGYAPREMNRLATLPAERRSLVLERGGALQRDGYTPNDINTWAALADEPREFVDHHSAILRGLGFEPWQINAHATFPAPARQRLGNLARDHGAILKGLGYAVWEIQSLAITPVAHQNAVVDLVRRHGDALKAGGFRGVGLDELVQMSTEQIHTVLAFARQHGERLTQHGYNDEDITEFALLPRDKQAAVLKSL